VKITINRSLRFLSTCQIIQFPLNNTTHAMPANILNLPKFLVISVENTDHDYHIYAETKQAPAKCPHCESTELVGFGRREQMVRDLPMHGKRVGIYVSTRRMQCRGCSKTFSEVLPEVDERRSMTSRLLAWIGRQSIKRTFASIAEEVGVVEGTVRMIFKDHISELEKDVRFETPTWMGMDEIHLIKYRGVITNIQNNTVVELLPNRNKETIINYFAGLEGRERIQYVAMDMWAPYRDAVALMLPQATIVIDKFHVVKMANEAMEKVRKSFRESLTPKQRRGLMHDRFVLLKREHDLNDKEVLLLSGWVRNYPELGLAHRLKEDFFKIYDAKSAEEALDKFAAWDIAVTHEVRDAFSDLIRAWRNWQPYIVSYFDHPITNAYTESLNSLIRVMDRIGRGYSFEALRAKILFTEGAHAHKQKRPRFERRSGVERKEQLDEIKLDRIPHMVGFAMDEMPLKLPKVKSTQLPDAPKNYGADISTLIRMIEEGEL
jgi:transposase